MREILNGFHAFSISGVMLELASEHEIIRWNWIHANTRMVWYFVDSRVSSEEYAQQMRNVLSVIAAKTGLPLYDLRKEVN